ncbi:MAG: 4-hydroxy-tetrahydrodipicolinate reductase [Lachnospirales bacterium]
MTKEKTKVIIHGLKGKMGMVVYNLLKDNDDFEIVAGIDRNIDEGEFSFKTFGNIYNCNVKADVVIDFSTASVVKDLVLYCVEKKLAIVICTTGLNDDTLDAISKASSSIPVFKSANMSIGINLINNLLKKSSKFLYDIGFDVEIIEKHHNRKIDAPSGTALLLADTIKDTIDDDNKYVYDRSSVTQPREKKDIGIHALRGGTIVGEHTVVFAGNNEIVELTHKAESREVFAAGAVNASKFVAGKEAGLYDMSDLIETIM